LLSIFFFDKKGPTNLLSHYSILKEPIRNEPRYIGDPFNLVKNFFYFFYAPIKTAEMNSIII
jgi:hypothetical protein